MDWKTLLKSEIEATYRAADGLMAMADDSALDWKPSSGKNWMTTGQLLRHAAGACGTSCRQFVTGDWGLPEGASVDDMSDEEMLPSAEKLPSAGSTEEARSLLAADKRLALEMVEKATNDMERATPAPWDPTPMPLGQRLLQMVEHLSHHKAQLFYYLKLQGKPVDTTHLYGMG